MENIANNFKLVETVLIQNFEKKFWREHVDRMKNSALSLGFAFDEKKLKKSFPETDSGVLRILLDKNGEFEYQIKKIEPTITSFIQISPIVINSKETMLFHKSDFRPWYEASQEKIKTNLVFDEIFFNEKKQITEGSRSNIILQINKTLCTPPIECGLLNGIMRQNLLESKKIQEKILYMQDLLNAEKIFCVNSVRQMQEVKLDFNR